LIGKIRDVPLEPTEFIEFLAPYPDDIQALTLGARLRLHELVGPASDLFFDATSAVCSGFSYTGEARDNFINLAVYAKHVTLIFPWGVRLNDPESRLKGEGNRVRNLRLEGIMTLHDPYVENLIAQAARSAKRPEVQIEPIRYVKVYRGPKRRPI
jgi:hypothetical protein